MTVTMKYKLVSPTCVWGPFEWHTAVADLNDVDGFW